MLAEVLWCPKCGQPTKCIREAAGHWCANWRCSPANGPSKGSLQLGTSSLTLEAACKQIVTINHQTLDVITSCLSISLDSEQPNPRGSPL